ncbi:DUF349 domain-containing protein [Hydrocarboniclastica marina]|uniref:DUF349 domain-containing protein n=1 Tax=Hydrocarboniclastica marina TaxID=2259620 RepID=A0A4P7XF18_9ALTE|nr:DUF349 domain-containing protein [Hydrocarboniclastica marina]QCF25549.1 DUF349 domain-containing protein [Hydrocarboniclastica marina]
MSSFFKRLFKQKSPKRNPEPQPRDIEQLDPKDPRDRDKLFKIVTDPQTSDREVIAALTKTGTLEFIVPWYVESPPRVQNIISDWIARQPGSARRLSQARGKLADPRLKRICDQLAGDTDENTGGASLQDQGPEQLERLALRSKSAHERREAAERIEDESTLQRVAKASKGRDKSVYQIARHKLQALREQDARAEAINAQTEKLIDECALHARTESTQFYSQRFESLTERWKALSETATPHQQERFHAAQAQCQVRLNELLAEAEKAAQATARSHERQETLALLDRTLDDLQNLAPDQIPGISSLDAMQKTQENRWLEATRDSPVDRSEQRKYEHLMQALRQYVQAVQNFEARRGQLEEATANGDANSLVNLVAEVAWPVGYTEPQVLNAARVLTLKRTVPAEAAITGSTETKEIDGLLDKLEDATQKKELKPSRRLLKEVQQRVDRVPGAGRRQFQGRLTLLARQVQELQDWQGFATRPKQESLCEQMEHLTDQHLDPELKASKIQELQKEWRELGGSSDQVLWQRFKKAADLAFEPCQQYFEIRNELKAANLHKREQLCDELSMFVSQVDWSACDWRGVEKIHRKAREEWREAKPIDFRRNRDIQRRFDVLLKEIDGRLNEERDRNERVKADIVERARALSELEPLNDAISQAKGLQKEWEAVGLTDQKRDRLLWQSFRAACDKVFARRDDQRAEQQAQTSEQLEAAQALLDAIETTLVSPELSNGAGAIRQRLQDYRKLELPPTHRDALDRRFEQLQDRFQQAAREAESAEIKRMWLQQLRQVPSDAPAQPDTEALREICVRAEILAGLESPEEDQQARMTLQVERLAAGLGQGDRIPDTRTEVDRLIGSWQKNAGATPPAHLQERIEHAFTSLVF